MAKKTAGAICLFAFLVAIGKQRSQLFVRVRTAPPANVAPFSQGDLERGARSEFLESWITRKRHNQLTWLPADTLKKSDFSSVLVLGDSYADDVDMGFYCWPSRLGRRLNLPVLNVARGGTKSIHVGAQLERAHAWIHEEFTLDARTLVILHTGGNDALLSLRNPRMLVLLISDLYRLRGSEDSERPELDFPIQIAKSVSPQLDQILASAAQYGHQDIILSTLPIVSCLPLARLLVHVMVPGADASFVAQSLRALGRSINQRVFERIEMLASKHGVRVRLFDEASELELLAEEAGVSQLSLLEGMKLVLRQLQRIIFGHMPANDFWHDGHHPAAQAHERLAEKVEGILKASHSPSASQIQDIA